MKKFQPSTVVSDEIWERLRTTALHDGIITPEEDKLISKIVLDVEAYSSLVDKAFEDNVISEEERIELFEGRIKILEKAYAVARDDARITGDEAEILKTIVNVVMSLEKKS